MNQSMQITNVIADTHPDLSGSARDTACVAIFWVREGLSDDQQKQALLEHLETQTGVMSARFSPTAPLMMIVDYTPGYTRASAIVQAVNGQGIRARLVGC